MLVEQNTTAAGEVHAEGVVAPSVILQAAGGGVTAVERQPLTGIENVFVPEGPPGGPLQGSSMSGAIPESVVPPTPEPPEPGPDPEPGLEPTVEYLAPAEAVCGSTDFTMRVVGTNFTDTSIIVFNRGEENTVFVSDTDLTTIVKPSLASIAAALPVLVRQGTYDSNEVMFTFTEAEALGREAGPFNITLIEDHMEGLALTLDGGEFKVGDDIAIEATGNASVNGAYEILEVNGLTIVIDSNYELATPIEAKGRLTITGAMP